MRTIRLAVVGTVLAASGLALATPAQAVTFAAKAVVINHVLVVKGNAGHQNVLVVVFQGMIKVLADSAGPIEAGAGCQTSNNMVLCDPTGITGLVIDGGDLADILGVRGTEFPAVTDVTVLGGSGTDDLVSDRGGTLDGGAGNDVLRSQVQADLLIGGTEYDTVSYAGRNVPITADADNTYGDDGAAGEGDTIKKDVEEIIGGSGPDNLTGNEFDNVLNGGPGDDILDGGPRGRRHDRRAGHRCGQVQHAHRWGHGDARPGLSLRRAWRTRLGRDRCGEHLGWVRS